MSDNNEPLVEIKDLHVEFDVRAGIVKAWMACSFDINRGQTMGVIGESGCGKSITARAILQMIPKPGKIASGADPLLPPGQRLQRQQPDEVINITKLDPDGETIRQIRGGEIGMIFQEPMSSLTPVYTAGDHINEAAQSAPPDAGQQGRRPDGRDDHGAPQRRPRRKRARSRSICCSKVGIPKPDGARRQLSAPAERRAAPARDDRHRALLRAGHADRRRADHRAGRVHRGPDPGPDARAAGEQRTWRSCSSPTTWA